MIKNKKYPVNYSTGRVNCPNIEQRIGDLLAHHAYKFACDFGFELYESDVQWIENNISKNSQNNTRDIFWRIDDAYNNPENKSRFLLENMATFFEQFIDAPGVPPNVNRLLIYTVGTLQAWAMMQKLAPYQYFFIERWFETCH